MEYQKTVFSEKKSSFFTTNINDFSNSLEFSCIYREIEIQAININVYELFYSEHLFA